MACDIYQICGGWDVAPHLQLFTIIMNIIVIIITTTIIIIIVIVIIVIVIIIPYGDELVLLSDSAFEKPTHLMVPNMLHPVLNHGFLGVFDIRGKGLLYKMRPHNKKLDYKPHWPINYSCIFPMNPIGNHS